MKKILILSNHHLYTYNFRKEIIQRLIDENYKVYLILPYGDKVELLKNMGCKYIDLPLDRRGTNPLTDIKLFYNYYKAITKIKPNAILTYTIKPNIYGGIISRIKKIPFFPNVTGLGTAVETESNIQKVLVFLCKLAYKKAKCVFFQNNDNKQFFSDKKISVENCRVIPGSGVNISEFSILPYPTEDKIKFMFISRIMREKGIDQYIEAAKVIKSKYANTEFHILGFCEDLFYQKKLNEMHKKGIITYHGMQNDVRKYHEIAHCTIHPTYYPEGMSNTLLESAACARPIITTNRSGCKEIIENRINGYIIEPQNSEDLIEKIELFLKLKHEEKIEMGLQGRAKVEKEFDRQIVVKAYMEELGKI